MSTTDGRGAAGHAGHITQSSARSRKNGCKQACGNKCRSRRKSRSARRHACRMGEQRPQLARLGERKCREFQTPPENAQGFGTAPEPGPGHPGTLAMRAVAAHSLPTKTRRRRAQNVQICMPLHPAKRHRMGMLCRTGRVSRRSSTDVHQRVLLCSRRRWFADRIASLHKCEDERVNGARKFVQP